MSLRLLVLPAALILLGGAAPVDLNPAAMKAFERYVQLTEARMLGELSGESPFLWIDRQPDTKHGTFLKQLQRGEVVSERLKTRDGKTEISVPDGLIHHWVGTVLLPNAKLDSVVAFVQDYAKYPDVFGPLIQQAKILKSTPTEFDVMMRTSTKKVITVVIDADYRVEYRRFGPTKLYTRSVTTNIHQVQNAGTPQETRIPAAKSDGYLWGMNTYCSFEERGEGVYEQCESVSLSRDVPYGLGWIINPIVSGMPRETLAFTLGKVRAGVK